MKKIILLFNLCLLLVGGLLAQNALSPDIKVEVKNEETVNTGSLEYSPTFYENGIVFISDAQVDSKDALQDQKIGKNTMSIFLSRRDEEGVLKAAAPFAKELTTKYHEGPITFNKTNDKVFFSRNDYINGKLEKSSNEVVKQMILSADLVGGVWSNVQELPFNDKEYDFVHPSINVDDNVLYFSSDRPGGFGGMDLWKVEKTGTSWGTPVNLGADVNTAANEVFPFIHADGTLFFSSNGHGSSGGGDIFFSKEYLGNFAAPVNLGPKFNTANDDFGFIIDRDKKNGYFSSNRDGGKGQDDIYSFFIDEDLGTDIFQYPEEHPAMLASGGAINGDGIAPGPGGNNGGNNNGTGFGNNKITLFVADRLTGAELGGSTVEYVDLEQLTNTEVVTDQDGNVIQLRSSSDGSVVTLSTEENAVKGITDQDGSYILNLGDGNYLVNINKPGYKPAQLMVSAKDGQEDVMVLLDKSGDCAPINGSVVYASNDPVSGANIAVQEVGGLTIQDITADASGHFNLCLECGKSYVVTVSKNGRTASENVSIPANCNNGQARQLTLNLDGGGGIATGTTIRLERIYYNFNDASIRPDARDELNTIVSLLQAYPSLEIEIASHTDSRGGVNYNDQLSQRRAEKVMAYLVRQGINANRLRPRGYGETRLLNGCSDGASCSELDHQYNRRTEIVITELNEPVDVQYIANEPENIDSAPSSVINGSGGSSSDNYSSSSSGSSGSQYYVIAGSFASKENANNRLSRVQQLGFDDAKIIRGNGATRNVVLIEIFSSYNRARDLADEIENVHNINTYVKRGR